MFENLFFSINVERILFYILVNKKCYASELSRRFDTALNGIQSTLIKLEKGGILVSLMEGKTRLYQFNPRYPFLSELTDFFNKAYLFIPDNIKQKYYQPIIRKRPRRTTKPL
ncbi:winged helix-turn-helix domain-containing protein [Thermoproteota archaeon]